MNARLNAYAAAPTLLKEYQRASIALTVAAGLEPSLNELVKIRASQINGCANCINLHTHEAREHGESEQRLFLLAAWREAPCFTERERAALAWVDALTRLSEGSAYESAYAGLAAHFNDEEKVKLTILINIINGWNRLGVGFGLWIEPAALKASLKAATA